jgi:hypothetical protein
MLAIIPFLYIRMDDDGKTEEERLFSRLCDNIVRGNLTEVVKLLRQVETDKQETYDYMIWLAAIKLQHEIIKVLVEEYGADINTRNGKPLVCASGENDIMLVKYLLDHGADHRSSYNIPLHLACMEKYVNIAKLLLEYGAGSPDEECLRLSCQREHTEVVNVLLEYGADPCGKSGGEYLRKASVRGNLELVKLLVDYGADRSRIHKKKATDEMLDYLPVNPRKVWMGNSIPQGPSRRLRQFHKDAMN